jgi:hypothetical protein
MRLSLCSFVVLTVIAVSSFARPQSRNGLPRFEDYPAANPGWRRPAAPVITGPDEHFRSVILEGARKGPNFAGHYTIVSWGCGSGCVSFVVADAISGNVYHAVPFVALGIPYQGTASGREFKGLDYRPNSSLLIADGCPENQDSTDEDFEKDCATRYYKWQQNRFVLLASTPVPSKSR